MSRFAPAVEVALILCVVGTHADTIKIAFWNALHFGYGKGECKDIEQIADIIEDYDVVALAEVMNNSKKDPNESTCVAVYGTDVLGHVEALVAELNSRGQTWSRIISPEARGRSDSYKEYYVFLHNHRVQRVECGCFFPDSSDIFEREPFFASFLAEEFDFTVIVHHAIRSSKSTELKLKREIQFLKDVFLSVQGLDPFEDDIILLGDFNVESSRDGWWNELRSISGLTALIDEPTSLGQDGLANPYDKIWIDACNTGPEHEFTGQSGILKFWDLVFSELPESERYSYAYENKGSFSDHVLIWAEFSIDLDDDPASNKSTAQRHANDSGVPRTPSLDEAKSENPMTQYLFLAS